MICRWGTISIALVLLVSAFTSVSRGGVRPQRVPDGGIHPQVQTDSRGRVHMIYFKGEPRHGDIFYVRSDDGGRNFTPPIRVNSHPESAVIIGTIRGPHLAIGRADRPHVAWMGSDRAEPKVGEKKAVPMLYTRLNDAGDAFEPQRNVIQNHPGLDGGGSIAADREGNVYVAWHAPEHAGGGGHGHGKQELQVARGARHNGHVRPAGHGDDEEERQVWIAHSRDDGKTFDPEVAAIPKKTGVCGCCGLNVIATDDGHVFITFRSATATVKRDIHVLASKDFGKTFQIAAIDPWNIGKCVMSTAAFTQRGDDVLAAWETKEQINFAVLRGATLAGEPLPIPGQGKNRKHPSVAVNGRGEYAVAWTEGTGWNKGGAVVWQLFDPQGRPIRGQAGRVDGLEPWSVPAAFVDNDGTFKIAY